MAKSLRSKYKKRLRTARRHHYDGIQGKESLTKIASRLNNPNYDMKTDCIKKLFCFNLIHYSIVELPSNAFLEPNNPNAVFPQIAKPNIMDFRSHKLAEGGYAAVNSFRKTRGDNKPKQKYEHTVRTTEEILLEKSKMMN